MSTTANENANGSISNTRGLPPVTIPNAGKFLRSLPSGGSSWDQIAADDVAGLASHVIQTWTWTDSLTDASRSGDIGVNATAWSMVTQVNISETNFNNQNYSAVFDTLKIGDMISIQGASYSNVQKFQISGAAVDHGTYRSYPVTVLSHNGTPPAKNTNTTVAFAVYGGGGSAPNTIPLPVQNGKWIKGVNGAVVWAPIIETDVRGLVVADTDWHLIGTSGQPPFESGFSLWDPPGSRTPRFRKLASGFVILSGVIRTPATSIIGPTMFTLPPGYRPAAPYDMPFAVFAGSYWAYANVQPNGAVTMSAGANVVGDSWVYLDGIHFYADQ